MSIIFKMLKYLKNYSNLIKSVIIIALAAVLVANSIGFYSCKSSYKEEVSVLQTELDSLSTKNEELETQVSEQDISLTDQTIRIQELEGIIQEFEVQIAGQEATLSDQATQIQKLEKENQALKIAATKVSESSAAKQSAKNTSSSSAGTKAETFKADGSYSQAAQVWNGLKALGLNDYVCAGIMGNIMAEVGGQTLDISRWSQYSQKNYYGICQWAGSRKQRLLNNFGTTLEAQIKFLGVELFEVIPKGNSFYNMQDEKEAALYFAKYYERCGSGSYSVRQSNATKALQYFTN